MEEQQKKMKKDKFQASFREAFVQKVNEKKKQIQKERMQANLREAFKKRIEEQKAQMASHDGTNSSLNGAISSQMNSVRSSKKSKKSI